MDTAGSLLELLKNLQVSQPPEPKEPLFTSFDIEGFVDYIKKNDCKNIVVMAGAGMSTSAGIPDFRTPGTGLYDNLQKYNLDDPTDIFSIDFFRENPRPFYCLAKELYPGLYHPTLGHYFVRLLDEKGLLLRHYTQNIDTLERVAGVDPEKLVEAHGSFATAHCTDPSCKAEMDADIVKENVLEGKIPKCPVCTSAVVKPDIVFFGENLPARFGSLSGKDLASADALIIIGTSLKVHPFANLINMVPDNVPRLLINRQYRDVFYEGTCDDGCLEFARLMGWGDELTLLREGAVAKLPPSHAQPVEPAKASDDEGKCSEGGEKKQGDAEADSPRSPETTGESNQPTPRDVTATASLTETPTSTTTEHEHDSS